MSKRFEISDILSQGSALLQQAAKTLADSGDEFSDLVQRVPPSMKSDNEGLSIAFAGQYSAGKSSLLSVLTDRNDIGIGDYHTARRRLRLERLKNIRYSWCTHGGACRP